MKELDCLKRYGSPLYVYDYEVLRDRCRKIKGFSKELENILKVKVSLHYSTKANGNLELLRVIRDEGLLVDAMSLLELQLAFRAGFNKDEILYVCNNVSSDEMNYVSSEDVLMCFDSVSQVETFGVNHSGSDIVVRINPGVVGVGHSKKVITSGSDTKFGITEDNFDDLFRVVSKYNLNIVGVHLHLGSLFLNDKISSYVKGIESFLEVVDKYFKDIRILDLGGGFGVPYKNDESSLDFDLLLEELSPVLKNFISNNKNINEIKFEPGRYVVCECGYILGSVTSVKNSYGSTWVGTDIGMNVLVRPSMYDAYHEIEVLNDENDKVKVNVCGNICESGDILGKERYVNKPKVGDVVKVYNAGAYGYSMMSNYTGRLRPAEILDYGDIIKLIRNRETLEDFMNFFN